MDLSTLNNPLDLALVVFLSMGGFVFLWAGAKNRNPAWLLYGIAASIPPFAIRSPLAWAIAVALGGAGWWIGRHMG